MRRPSLAWLLAWAELRFRWRRFLIAVAGASIAFCLTLLLTGFRDGATLELENTLAHLGADAYVVKAGVHGPFTTTAQLPADLARQVARLPGVAHADPVVTLRHSIESAPAVDVYLIGARPGGLGMPRVRAGRAPVRRGEAVLDERGGRDIGERFLLGGREFVVVGLVQRSSVWGGVPDLFVPLADAQDLVLGGQRGATAILTRGLPAVALPGTRVLDRAEALLDLTRPVRNAMTVVDMFRFLVWVVAAAIIGSLLYVSALERSRDFAVCKAFGTTGGELVAALVLQAVLLTSVAGAIGLLLARVMTGLFPAIISFPARTLVLLPVVAVAVGSVASLGGARRALRVDPASAFAGP